MLKTCKVLTSLRFFTNVHCQHFLQQHSKTTPTRRNRQNQITIHNTERNVFLTSWYLICFQKLKYTFTSFKIQYIWHAAQKKKKKEKYQISTQMKRTLWRKQKHRSDDKMYIQSFTNTGTAKKKTPQNKTCTYSHILYAEEDDGKIIILSEISLVPPCEEFHSNSTPRTWKVINRSFLHEVYFPFPLEQILKLPGGKFGNSIWHRAWRTSGREHPFWVVVGQTVLN